MDVIRAKTATLFSTASEVGAVVAGQERETRETLRDYGLHLGTAFQLVDDVLDYSARQHRLGKTVGDDFREGKITLPVVLAVERGTRQEREFWERTLEAMDQRDGDLEQAMVILARNSALQATMVEARRHADKAASLTAHLPDNVFRDALIDLAGFCVDRQF